MLPNVKNEETDGTSTSTPLWQGKKKNRDLHSEDGERGLLGGKEDKGSLPMERKQTNE